MTKINSIKTSNGSIHKIDEGIGFPSSKYVDLEVPAFSENFSFSVTAPANGYLYIRVRRTDSVYVHLIDLETGLSTTSGWGTGTGVVRANLQCTKGHKYRVEGRADAIEEFRFIYAQGSEPDEE